MRRKPNPEQRRRELCDTAIRLLAEDGTKGVSHLKVDRRTGLPDGTTSFYFRTRSALLQAVAERVAELDLVDLRTATGEGPASAPGHRSRPSGLATLVLQAATGERMTRAKARIELALEAARDPVLDAALTRHDREFFALIRDAVLRLQPGDPEPGPASVDTQTVDTQTYVVMMFISGVISAFARGDHRIRTPEELDRMIAGIVGGLGHTDGRTTRRCEETGKDATA